MQYYNERFQKWIQNFTYVNNFKISTEKNEYKYYFQIVLL